MGLESIVDQGVALSIPVDGNPQEYRFKLKFAGVRHLVLKYGTIDDAYKAFLSLIPKKVINESGEEVIGKFLLTSASVDIMTDWVFATLLWDIPELTLKGVDDIIDLHNMHLFIQGVSGAFLESMPIPTGGRVVPPAKAQ